MFLADNGGCAETITDGWGQRLSTGPSGQEFTRDGRKVQYANNPAIDPGPEDTYQSYGVAWANASNTPFRKYKCWTHEGGISTPFIMHWPAGISGETAENSAPTSPATRCHGDRRGPLRRRIPNDNRQSHHSTCEGFSLRGASLISRTAAKPCSGNTKATVPSAKANGNSSASTSANSIINITMMRPSAAQASNLGNSTISKQTAAN